jgi:hypothetical protein
VGLLFLNLGLKLDRFDMMREVVKINGCGLLLLEFNFLHPYLLVLYLFFNLKLVDAALLVGLVFLHQDDAFEGQIFVHNPGWTLGSPVLEQRDHLEY